MSQQDQQDQTEVPQTTTSQDGDIQRLGHQIASFAGVIIVAAVEFGIPLTPGQQSSILSIIVVGWALASTLYGIRHRVTRTTTQPTSRHRSTSSSSRDSRLRNRDANEPLTIGTDDGHQPSGTVQLP